MADSEAGGRAPHEGAAILLEEDPKTAFKEELEETEAEIRELEELLVDADEEIAELKEERDYLLDIEADLADGIVPGGMQTTSREHVWDNDPVTVSGGVLDVIEKYRAQFSERKAVTVCVNGKWLKLDEEMRADAPPLKLVCPPSPERNTDAISGELVSTKRDAICIGAQSRHEVTIKVPAGGQLRFWFMVEEPGLDIDFSLLKLDAGSGNVMHRKSAKATGVRLPWHGYMHAEIGGTEAPPEDDNSGDKKWVGGDDNSRFTSRSNVRGMWGTALKACEVVFVWDNSYSLLTKKTVSLEVKVRRQLEH
jgi:hypothetical protein